MIRLLIAIIAMGWTSLALAQPSDAYLIEGLPPAAAAPSNVEAEAYAIGKKLRCPVCQGLSIADSNAEGAVMIQRRINELVAAGYTETQIQDYFIDKYGEWILLEPKPEGLNLLIWVAPAAAAGLGLFGLVATSRRREVSTQASSAISQTSYEEKLLQELENDI